MPQGLERNGTWSLRSRQFCSRISQTFPGEHVTGRLSSQRPVQGLRIGIYKKAPKDVQVPAPGLTWSVEGLRRVSTCFASLLATGPKLRQWGVAQARQNARRVAKPGPEASCLRLKPPLTLPVCRAGSGERLWAQGHLRSWKGLEG